MARFAGFLSACLAAALATSAVASPAKPTLRDQVTAWRQSHERPIVEEFDALLRLPDVATNVADIEANARLLVPMLEKRGLKTRLLSAGPGTPPAIYGELKVPGARRTVVYYAHYDGQPVTPAQWRSPPFVPTMRDGLNGADVDWRKGAGPLNPEWRLFARAAGDDKVSIVALLSALDALKASGRKPSVNVKVFLDGEEEQGSPHLEAILRQNTELLKSDLWLIGDGPVHQSRRWQLYFGARGVTGVEMTVYGPSRALHSGHYGNWAPNPAVMAAELVTSLRDSDGRILVAGYGDHVRPVSPAERKALDAMPPVEDALKQELQLGRSEGSDRLADSLMRPAINVRGISVGKTGAEAANAVPTEAHVSLDLRLVPDLTPEEARTKIEAHLKAHGWTVVTAEPDAATRLASPRLVRLQWEAGYPALRTDMDLPASRGLIASIERAAKTGGGGPVVVTPMLGGSVPMYLFADIFHTPVVGLPIANHDDNQHASNENLRLQNLWDGIAEYAAVLGDFSW
jgi:acetylornithine deacetylase/succinyl-diaminopimelate desuccinylase-like protein